MNSLAIRHSNLKVRIWSSLDFTIGQSQPPKKDRERNPWNFRRDAYWNGYKWQYFIEIEVNHYLLAQLKKHGKGLTLKQLCSLFEAYEACDRHNEALQVADAINRLSMGLSDATNSHKNSQQSDLVEKTTRNQGVQRAKRGVKGITTYGKKMVKSAAVLLERQLGRRCLMFGTATLPALTPEEFILVCESWSELTRQFFQELQRLLARRGLSTDYVQVTELQEERFLKWGQIAPHLHWVCQSRETPYEDYAIKPDEIRRLWERLLSNLLGRRVDGKAATRIEAPKKPVGKELGKYMSKGGKLVYAIECEGRENELPSAWWGASKELKRAVKESIVELTDHRALYLDKNLAKMQLAGLISFRKIYREITDPNTGQSYERCVGVTGWFVSEAALEKFLYDSIKVAA